MTVHMKSCWGSDVVYNLTTRRGAPQFEFAAHSLAQALRLRTSSPELLIDHHGSTTSPLRPLRLSVVTSLLRRPTRMEGREIMPIA